MQFSLQKYFSTPEMILPIILISLFSLQFASAYPLAADPRIINGTDANILEFPFIVLQLISMRSSHEMLINLNLPEF